MLQTTLWRRTPLKSGLIVLKLPIHYFMSNRPTCATFQCRNDFLWWKKNPEYLSSFPDHDIVIVTISNPQDVGSYTVASTGQCELFYCFIKFFPGDKKRSEK